MSTPRIRNCANVHEFERVIDELHVQGYEALDRGADTAMLRRKTWGSFGGHVLLFLFTFWWTLGIGNLLFALIARYSAEKVFVRCLPQPQYEQHYVPVAQPRL